MKKKILIIGCGYGGLVCAWRLSGFRAQAEVQLIDKGEYFNFLPLLPDCLGRNLPSDCLRFPIRQLSGIYGFNFIHEEVKSLDLKNRKVLTTAGFLDYDYLVIASGSETNFYGNEVIKKYAEKLDDAGDAARIRSRLEKEPFEAYLVSGGGYTGIEVATNLRLYLDRVSKKHKVIIIERAPSVLGPLPEWMRNYVYQNLKKMNIEVLTSTVIEGMDERKIFVSGKGEFSNSLLIWAAGVKTSDFIQKLDVPKNPQGRIKVDDYLRVNETCFAIGDASYFSYQGAFLRMAVQFAIAGGSSAAFNIINSIMGKPLHKYRPIDLGYVIPMANNRSCGHVLGMDLRGTPATVCHYVMSVYRAYGLRNKIGIIRALSKC